MKIRETVSFPYGQHTEPHKVRGWMPGGVKTNVLARFFCASLAAHLVLVCGLRFFSFRERQEQQPLMVDFTLESSAPCPVLSPPSPRPAPLIARTPAPPPRRSRDAVIKTPDTPAPLQSAVPDKVSISKPVTVPKPSAAAEASGQISRKTGAETSPLPSSGENRNSNTGKNGQTTSSKSAGGETGHSGAENSAYLREQFTYIRDTVMRRLVYPSYARRMGWSGKVIIRFVVAEDGSVHEFKVREDSGFPILDKEAVEAVLRAAPFPRPPARVEVVLPVTYRLLQ